MEYQVYFSQFLCSWRFKGLFGNVKAFHEDVHYILNKFNFLSFWFYFMFQIYLPHLDSPLPRWFSSANGFFFRIRFVLLLMLPICAWISTIIFLFAWFSDTSYTLDFWFCWWEASMTDKFIWSIGQLFDHGDFPLVCLLPSKITRTMCS